MIEADTIRRMFNTWVNLTNITLNMSSDSPSDEEVMSHQAYPFGPRRPPWISADDEYNMKRDFIEMRKMIAEIDAQTTTYVQVCIEREAGK